METTALHQIQSFSPHHSMMQPSTVNATPTQQDLSEGQFTNVPSYYCTTSHEHSETDKEGNQTPFNSEEAKNVNTKENNKNGLDSSDSNIDIFISNVVCTFSVRCHLNLKKIGMEGINVEYKREAGKVMMKMRNPHCTATIWSSGKITVTGNSSESDAKVSARRIARKLQKIGFRVHFHQFQVVNVLGTCRLPFAIRIAQFSEQHPQTASYEPEIHPAVTYKIKSPKATLKVFSTGSITVTAPSVENIQHAIHHIYPLVEPYKMERVEKKQDKPERKRVRKDKWKQDILRVGSDEDEEIKEEPKEVDLEKDPLDSDEDECENEDEEVEVDEDEEWESELSDDDDL